MILEKLPYNLTICKVATIESIHLEDDFYFIGKTDDELSLVCETVNAPANTLEREDGWKGFRIRGVLDFSMVGVLSKLSGVLADNGVGIFAISTFNTDYILVKEKDFDRAMKALSEAGYSIS